MSVRLQLRPARYLLSSLSASRIFSTMISRSTDYVEYCRETAANLKSLHDLALRGRGKEAITAAIHERIIREVGLGPDDELVDIGCGDGTLLRMAAQIGVRSA